MMDDLKSFQDGTTSHEINPQYPSTHPADALIEDIERSIMKIEMEPLVTSTRRDSPASVRTESPITPKTRLPQPDLLTTTRLPRSDSPARTRLLRPDSPTRIRLPRPDSPAHTTRLPRPESPATLKTRLPPRTQSEPRHTSPTRRVDEGETSPAKERMEQLRAMLGDLTEDEFVDVVGKLLGKR
ncbi:hypothetical protein BC829DRAFT_423251 [Chytridium lagenaria]|nr:hypothetical protein BC829DRAFT_423251 [Chytridium lagenaria]